MWERWPWLHSASCKVTKWVVEKFCKVVGWAENLIWAGNASYAIKERIKKVFGTEIKCEQGEILCAISMSYVFDALE